MAAMGDAVPAFLQRPAIEHAWQFSGFEGATPEHLIETAQRFAGDPALKRLAWYCHWRLYDDPKKEHYRFGLDDRLEKALGQDLCGLLYLLVSLGLVPRLQAYHLQLGLPERRSRARRRSKSGVFCSIISTATTGGSASIAINSGGSATISRRTGTSGWGGWNIGPASTTAESTSIGIARMAR